MRVARRPSWVWIVFIAVIVTVATTVVTVAAVRLTAAPPLATVSFDVPATVLLDGVAPAPIPAPAGGSFALATSMNGIVAGHGATTVRAIGSVAKAMTALVVLKTHPVVPGAAGPSVTMTASDVALYRHAVAQGGSNLPVHAGEVLTERDLLLALLLPSADNIAETLAVWVSGNRTTFISLLNATAAEMGMGHTHFDDPSGLSSRTVSTAEDLVALGRAVIATPALAQLVGTTRATLPGGTVLRNLDILLGTQPGWLGIKTGWTGAAGGCLLFAASRSYAPGRAVTVWGAVLGQPRLRSGDPAHPELGEAFVAARIAAVAALSGYAAVDLAAVSVTSASGTLSTRWGSSAGVAVAPHTPDIVVVRAGAILNLRSTFTPPRAPIAAGTTVGTLRGALPGGTTVTWDIASVDAVAAPSLWWRLFSA